MNKTASDVRTLNFSELTVKSEDLLSGPIKAGHSIPFRYKTIDGIRFQVPRYIYRLEMAEARNRRPVKGWSFKAPRGKSQSISDAASGGIKQSFIEIISIFSDWLMENPPDDHNISLKTTSKVRDASGLNIAGVWFYGAESGKHSYSLSVCVSFPAKKNMNVSRSFRFGTVEFIPGGYNAYVYPTKMNRAILKAVALRKFAEAEIKKHGYVRNLISEKEMSDQFIARYLTEFDINRINRIGIEQVIRAAVK